MSSGLELEVDGARSGPTTPQVLRSARVLPAPRATLFALVNDPSRLDALTPPWLRLVPRDWPEGRPVQVGDEIDYRFAWRGIPLPWRSRILARREGQILVYEQAKGPYRSFLHRHRFADAGSGATRLEEEIELSVFGPRWLGRLVAEELERILATRWQRLERWCATGRIEGS